MNELHRVVLEVCSAGLGEYLSAAVGAAARDPAARLRAHANAYCRFALERRDIYHALFGVTSTLTPSPRPSSSLGGKCVPGPGRAHRRLPTAASNARRHSRDRRGAPWAAVHGLVTLRVRTPGFPWRHLERLIDHTLATELGVR
jgi:hypothetical protein